MHLSHLQIAVLAFWLLAVLAYFKGTYSAARFQLKEGRPKVLKAAAYVGNLPVRLLLSIIAGGVATLVWGLLAAFVWAMWKVAMQ
jgi:hypothetical protein